MTPLASSTSVTALQMKQRVSWFHLTDVLWTRLQCGRLCRDSQASIISLRPSGPQGEAVHYAAAWQRQAPPNETAQAELY